MKTFVWIRLVGALGVMPALVACRGERATVPEYDAVSDPRTAEEEARLGAGSRASVAAAEPTIWAQEAELLASDGATDGTFGISVVVNGDTALVGAYRDAGTRGAVYVFVRSGSSWSPQQKLTADDGAGGDFYGFALAVSGDTALVGAAGNASSRGAVYVFVRSGSSWSPQQKLTADDGAQGDLFGSAVASSGDTALVGAAFKASFQGAVYVFARSGSSWSLQQELTAADGASGDLLGGSLAMNGNTALVGARGRAAGRGAAYAFLHDGSSWSPQQTLTTVDGEENDLFGTSVALNGDTAVVGAPSTGSDEGTAFGFVRSGSTWAPPRTLSANDGAARDQLGTSVAVNGDAALVGAPGKDSNQGAAYWFVRSGDLWPPQQTLTADDGAAGDQFGFSVAVSGGTAFVGAPFKYSGRGAAYVFNRKSILGVSCVDDAQCASGRCTDGVCCKVAACPASDRCHDAACQPGTGVCSNLAREDGSPCGDGTCQSGVCEGGATGTGNGSTTTGTGGSSTGGVGEAGGDTPGSMDLSCRFSAPGSGPSACASWLGALALGALLRRRRMTKRLKFRATAARLSPL